MMLVDYKCKCCGEIFKKDKSSGRYICDECRTASALKNRKEMQGRCQQIYKEARLKRHKAVKCKSVSQILREIAAYNEKNGTSLSYGEYMSLTLKQKSGKI